jgi:TPR repeat protein
LVVVVSIMVVLAGLLAWSAEQQRIRADNLRKVAEEQKAVAEEQRRQVDRVLTSATSIIVKLQNQMDIDTRKEAFAVFKAGADHGNANSMGQLGVVCANGLAVAQDFAKARGRFERAADKANTSAMTNLGLLYCSGTGGVQDYAKAREWFEKGR